MSNNMLKLNDDKTELIVFTSKCQADANTVNTLRVGSNIIHSAPVVKYLGFYLDSQLTMLNQVNSIIKACYYHLRNIGKIRKFITDNACKILVHSLIISRLDYCNALLCGLPDAVSSRLQRVQNSAARLISRTGRRQHISPVLQDLHWLPVQYRSNYKILIHTYKALNGTAPSYISDKLHHYQPTRLLRSQSKSLLIVPKCNTATYRKKRFDHTATILWNDLPLEIKQASSLYTFKKLLKTQFFVSAFY